MFDGKKLKEKRLLAGLSMRVLADQIGVNEESLRKWEGGAVPRNPEDVRKVEQWMGVEEKKSEDYKDKYIALLERTNETLEATIKKLIK